MSKKLDKRYQLDPKKKYVTLSDYPKGLAYKGDGSTLKKTPSYTDVVGGTVATAGAILKQRGAVIRVKINDGIIIHGSCDVVENRVNVEVQNGKVFRLLEMG